jgi:hypothetical protein
LKCTGSEIGSGGHETQEEGRREEPDPKQRNLEISTVKMEAACSSSSETLLSAYRASQPKRLQS